SERYCAGETPRADYEAAFRDAWLAWAPLDSYQFGPIEQSGAALTVNFWPDKKNFVGRGLRELLAQPEAAQRDPATVAAGSAAAQGLPAIEMLLYTDAPECPAAIGISGNLSALAGGLYDGWFGDLGWAEIARTAGPDNPVYLSSEEFTKTVYTALDFGLTRIADARLGRPLGTYERSFPTRAEAWRSGLTNQIIGAQLSGIAEMVRDGFAGAVPPDEIDEWLEVMDQTQARLDAIGVPLAEAVEDPMTRIRVEGLQTQVQYLKMKLAQDIGPALGVETGFSAADGD
ncbi:MAG: imelysin family protein, partial [Paracoccaceae bacterium]